MHVKGWTLPELIAVMLVLLALSNLAILPSGKVLDIGKKVQAQGDMIKIGSAISQFNAHKGRYPVNQQELTVSMNGNAPYLESLPAADPWGTTNAGINGTGGASAYCYARTTKGFALWSLGSNKTNNSGGSGSSLPGTFGSDDVGVLSQ